MQAGRVDKLDQLESICRPVYYRYMAVLERFINLLRDSDYDVSQSEKDLEYSLRFVVPGHYLKNHSNHCIVQMTKSFVSIATMKVLGDLGLRNPKQEREVECIMQELAYLTFEDLWISSVAGFRFQRQRIDSLLCQLMDSHDRQRQQVLDHLHDGLLQELAIISLRLNMLRELQKNNSSAADKELGSIISLITTLIHDVRSLCSSLKGSWTEKGGFFFSLNSLATEVERRFGIPVKLETCQVQSEPLGSCARVLFQVVQEALYNAGKHSKAKSIKVRIGNQDGQIMVIVKDDGVGFDVRTTVREAWCSGHLGIALMKERVRMLNGRLEIRSKPRGGTKVIILVPNARQKT